MAITFQPIVVDTAFERDGLLLLRDGALTAVLVRLDGTYDDPDWNPAWTNCWFVEASFANDEANGKIFKTERHAAEWFEAHQERRAARAPAEKELAA
jgi:hypothetical protein